MRYWQTITCTAILLIAIGGITRAQQSSTASPATAPSEIASLKVQVVLSRYQGEKKISSFPYTLSVIADRNRVELRMGSQIPVSVMVQGTPTTTFKDVGTTIFCAAAPVGGDKFLLELTVSDSSVYEDTTKPPSPSSSLPAPGHAAALQPLRSFSSSNTLILKDGQSSQFATAADRITGEVTKVDVMLTVVK